MAQRSTRVTSITNPRLRNTWSAHWPRRPEVARYLIARGAQTDILMAAALGDLELVRQHLDDDPASVRISVSEKDFPKQNPRSGGSIYIFGFGWTRTAHMLANKFGHEDVFGLLMQRSSLGLRFAIACEVGNQEMAKSLLAKHPNVIEKQPPEAYRRIIGAALRNNARAVSMMLSAGWPANVQGNHDQTALHWAAFHGNVEMVRALLDHQAPLEAEEQQFKGTPLGWALYGSEHGWHRDAGDYPGTVQELLSAGAKAPRPIEELEAPEEVLEVMRRHESASSSLLRTVRETPESATSLHPASGASRSCCRDTVVVYSPYNRWRIRENDLFRSMGPVLCSRPGCFAASPPSVRDR